MVLMEIGRQFENALLFGYQPKAVITFGTEGYKAILIHRERERRRKELLRLKQRELIRYRQIGDRYEVALTSKGREQLFRLKVLDSDWFEDGRSCMVVFDIPESRRALRKQLREFLTDAGFVSIQKSVWLSPYNAEDALRELFEANGAARWIWIFTVEASKRSFRPHV